MKKTGWLVILLMASLCSFGQKNLTLLSNYTFAPGVTCAGVYHYNRVGHEYALVGTSRGVVIVDITNPYSPQHVYDIPDTGSEWMEVKGWGDYAYVSNEGSPGHPGGGITVINLTSLPDTPVVHKKYTGDGAIAGQLSTGHTVQAVDGYLYVNGSNIPPQGTLMFSLADPWNPQYVGAYSYNGEYVHDCFVRGDTLITSEIYIGQFVISSIANRTINPPQLASQSTPCQFNHSSWMSDNNHYLFTTDEKPDCPLGSYDISDFNNITLLDEYRTTKNPIGEVHNPRVLNDFIVCACYGDTAHTGSQVTIVDAAHPDNLIEVGNVQLCPPAAGLMICWDADPFLPSGNIIATEGNHGLFVLGPTYRRACYLEGTVTKCQTDTPLNNVTVQILMPPADTLVLATSNTSFQGIYKTGLADSGTYDVRFIPPLADSAYSPKTIAGVTLKNGILTSIDIGLCIGPTGFHENVAAADLCYIYPNPANNLLTIHSSLFHFNDDIKISIMNVLGQTLQEEKYKWDEDLNINVKNLPAGIYFIQIKSESSNVVKRFVKE